MRTMGRLLSFLASSKGWIGLVVLLGAMTIGSSIALMGISAYLISMAALHPSIAVLQVSIVAVRFFGIARGVFRYLERYVSHKVTFDLLARLRVWFYQALEPLAPAHLLHHSSGDLLSRAVADIEALQHFYVRVIAPPMVAILIALAMGWFLASYDPGLSLILLIFLCLAGAGVPFLTRTLSRRFGARLVNVRSELYTRLVDSVQGMADLLAFGQREHTLTQLESTGQNFARSQKRLAKVSGLHSGLSNLATALGMWGVLVMGISLVAEGSFDGVYLAAIVLAALASFEAILPLPQAAQHLDESLEAARRLFDVLDAQPAVQDFSETLPPPQNFSLEIKDLCFRYTSNNALVLNNLSFNLPQGGRLALVGPSGAGKTTLSNLLLRFWEIQAGQILLGGNDICHYRQDDIRRVFAVVSQDGHLFNATVRENLLLGRPDATDDELTHAAQQAQIHDFIQSLPKGYETWIGEQGLRLSGGERQRLLIGRALLKDAPILILDEATANVDTLTEREILQAIHTAMDGRTTLMITHRLVGLDTMDEIIVLHGGQVVERGQHRALIEKGGLYRQMWDLQNQALIGMRPDQRPAPAGEIVF